jgi:hypothetical protein
LRIDVRHCAVAANAVTGCNRIDPEHALQFGDLDAPLTGFVLGVGQPPGLQRPVDGRGRAAGQLGCL